MRVLFVGSSNYDEGISSIVTNQGRSVAASGVEVEYFGIRGKGVSGYLKNIHPLRKALKKGRYDIIHAHYGISGVVALMAHKREKVVISFMGSDLIGKGNLGLRQKMTGRMETVLNKFLARHCYSYTIVKSGEMAGQLAKVKNLSVVPNGVDLSLFHPVSKEHSREALGIRPGERLVLFASDPGRREKNYSLASEAVSRIQDEKIRMIPLVRISQADMKQYYSAADLLLLTSLYEGSPNVIKEALACNCPVVSTDVGDVRTLIGGLEGCSVCSYDPQEVAEKIKQGLNFSAEGKSCRGKERIVELALDSASIAGKIKGIYEELLS